MDVVKFYKTNDYYGWLNNFKKAKMFIYGRWWKNVESAYQAQKTTNPDEYDVIWLAATPREARDKGQLVAMRPDWNDVKVSVMEECVLAKFIQNHDLREKLFGTGNSNIIEDSPIDYFWGCGKDGNGENNLGKILMRVRDQLRKNDFENNDVDVLKRKRALGLSLTTYQEYILDGEL